MSAGRQHWSMASRHGAISFDHLSDIRPWGPKDRLSDATRAALAEDIAAFPDEPRRIEIELWYRTQRNDRMSAARRLRQRIADLGGTVEAEREIPDIVYHAMLVELPAHAMARLVAERERGLVLVNEIMLILQQTRAPVAIEELEPVPAPLHQRLVPVEGRAPIIALFDRMPLTGHRALTGRVVLDDPEDHDARYEAHQRQHGTEMASIILHGDAHAPSPLPHQLDVRPVLVPDERRERFPEDQARRLRGRIGHCKSRRRRGAPGGSDLRTGCADDQSALGRAEARFAGMISRVGAAADRFAFDYRLLILVSAGDIWERLAVPGVSTATELRTWTRRAHVAVSLGRDGRERRRRRTLAG